MLRLCTRPTGNPKGSPKTQLDKNIQSGTSVSCKDLAEKMLNPKLARNSETGLKELEGAPWPLTVQSLYHWSSKARKNAKRDVPKLALMALTEVLVVSKYRPADSTPVVSVVASAAPTTGQRSPLVRASRHPRVHLPSRPHRRSQPCRKAREGQKIQAYWPLLTALPLISLDFSMCPGRRARRGGRAPIRLASQPKCRRTVQQSRRRQHY